MNNNTLRKNMSINKILTLGFLITITVNTQNTLCMDPEKKQLVEKTEQRVEHELAQISIQIRTHNELLLSPYKHHENLLQEKLNTVNPDLSAHIFKDLTDIHSKECLYNDLGEYCYRMLGQIKNNIKKNRLDLCFNVKRYLTNQIRNRRTDESIDELINECYEESKKAPGNCSTSNSWHDIALFSCIACAQKKYIQSDESYSKKIINEPYGESDFTPLHIATMCGSEELITFLISVGALLDSPDIYGRTPLSMAVTLRKIYALKILLNHGAPVDYGTIIAALTPQILRAKLRCWNF